MYLKRLRDLRTDHDYTQEKLSKIIGINRSLYSKYETGVRTIPIDLLRTLAKLYNTSIDYIVGDTNLPTRYPEIKKL